MSLEVQVWMASKEVADRLDLHVRTLRNWLEMFVPASERQKNPQGHYLISEVGCALLKEVKARKEAGNASLRDIKRQLIDEGLLPSDMLLAEEEAASAADSSALSGSFRDGELIVQEAILQFRKELANLSALQQMQSSILEKIADIEEMQESLRLEMRRVTFEMDLMQQRLTRRKHRHERYQSRWSLNPFRWFTRSGRSVTAD